MDINNQKGISVIEVIVATGILALILLGIFQLVSYSHITIRKNENQARATSLASEAIEAVRLMRDDNWEIFAAYSTGSSYHPSEGSEWELQAGCETIEIFQRCVEIDKVYRDDITGNPVESGGTEDPGARKVTVNIDWKDNNRDHNYFLETFLTNWR